MRQDNINIQPLVFRILLVSVLLNGCVSNRGPVLPARASINQQVQLLFGTETNASIISDAERLVAALGLRIQESSRDQVWAALVGKLSLVDDVILFGNINGKGRMVFMVLGYNSDSIWTRQTYAFYFDEVGKLSRVSIGVENGPVELLRINPIQG